MMSYLWTRTAHRLHNTFLGIVSGEKSGCLSRIILMFLIALVPVYYGIIVLRNWRFNRAQSSLLHRQPKNRSNLIKQATIPVISVGNLTTGGTGKTPLVAWLCQQIASRGIKVAVISRGYGSRQDSNKNDETLELMARLPDVDFLNGRCRFTQIQTAVDQFGTQVAVLDDGFQHRQLYRDLDLLLIDATQPFGYGRLLPAGLLREPLSGLERADVIVLTRCELVDVQRKQELRQKISKINQRLLIVEASTRPVGWINAQGERFPLETFQATPIYSFCGIGNPKNFMGTLKNLGCQIEGFDFYPDHYDYSRQDWEDLVHRAQRVSARNLVCTHKDLVKMGSRSDHRMPLVALLTETVLETNEPELIRRIETVIAGRS